MKIAVIGAGAIGGTLAAELTDQGYSVDCIDKNPTHIQKVNDQGLIVDGVFGKKIYHKIEIQDKPNKNSKYDIVFLAVKAVNTPAACKKIKPFLKKTSYLVSLQNGINNDQILKIIPENNFIAGVVGHGVTNVGPGHLRYTSKEKHFVIGRLDGIKNEKKLQDIAQLLCKIAPTNISNNILGEQWSKLVSNCIINPFCAISNQTFGKNVRNKNIREKMLKVINETISVGKKIGINFAKLAGKYDLERIFYPDTAWTRIKGTIMLHLIIIKHGKIKSSMWQDLQNKQKTEIDFLNGYVATLGKKLKISTPVSTWVTNEIKKLEG